MKYFKTALIISIFQVLNATSLLAAIHPISKSKGNYKEKHWNERESFKERYSATENDGTAAIISSGLPVESKNIYDEELDSLVQIKKTPPANTNSKTLNNIALSEFDSVPQEHVEEVAERIKYAYDILKRFGRAYDYRVVTLTEFRKILKDLELKKPNS